MHKAPFPSAGIPEPEGFKDSSRGLSQAIPPDIAKRASHPGGVAEGSETKAPKLCATPPGSARGNISTGGIAKRSTPGYFLGTLRVRELY
jgi:hypothetical protein